MSKTRNFGVTSDIEQKDGVSVAAETAGVDGMADTVGVPDNPDNPVCPENPGAAEKAETAETAVPTVLVYIGPSVFRTELISGRAFITHGKKLDEIIPDELHKYPLARMMFVTPDELSAARARIHDPGTALGNAYKTLSEN
ncbi:unknown [Eubacterium sp. CAG:786]|nr:unknown [Eubacterium sp. CAG:786]